jgi:hypothetical protein
MDLSLGAVKDGAAKASESTTDGDGKYFVCRKSGVVGASWGVVGASV